jgi:hypothetical protein
MDCMGAHGHRSKTHQKSFCGKSKCAQQPSEASLETKWGRWVREGGAAGPPGALG